MVDPLVSEKFSSFMGALFVEIHAVYEKGSSSNHPEWYCAAVDLFRPGMTFRAYFTLDEYGQIFVEDLQRWWFG